MRKVIMLRFVSAEIENEAESISSLHKEIGLDKESLTIGRSLSSDIVISLPTFSRQHCVFHYIKESGKWDLVDTSSTGTWVNGKQLSQERPQILEDNDTIKLSSSSVVYKFTYVPLERWSSTWSTPGPSSSRPRETNDTKPLRQALSSQNTDFGQNLKENASLVGHVPEAQLKILAAEEAEKRKALEQTFAKDLLAEQNKLEGLQSELASVKEISSKKFEEVNNELQEKSSKLQNATEKLTSERERHLKEKELIVQENALLLNEKIRLEEEVKQLSEASQKLSNTVTTINKEKDDLCKEKESLLTTIDNLETSFTEERARKDIEVHNQLLLFESVLESELQCAICTEIVCNPQTLVCGHTFCQVCIDEWRDKNPQCPTCRKKVKRTYPSTMINSIVNKMADNLTEDFKTKRSQLVNERNEQTVNKRRRLYEEIGEPQAFIDLTTTPIHQ